MASTVNELFTQNYDHIGGVVQYGDTDSFFGSSNIISNFGTKTIEELFNTCSQFWKNGDKEYAYNPDLLVLSYDPDTTAPYFDNINYIYRHKVSKDLYEIEDELGNTVTVTEDHSVMIERDGKLMSVKPLEIEPDDILISVKYDN